MLRLIGAYENQPKSLYIYLFYTKYKYLIICSMDNTMEHKQIVVRWMEFEIPSFFERDLKIDITKDFIFTISGPRRTGKTYFCFQLIKNLLNQGISKQNILYINFEDNKLIGATSEDLEKIFAFYIELFQINTKQNIYLFFDEIQTVTNWDAWVRKIYDTRKDIKLILTGSSSKLLSREISTRLRGRVINKEIFPASFREIVKWKNLEFNIDTISYSKNKNEIKRLFTHYLNYGGYPAVVFDDKDENLILQGYYDSMILKDIAERHKVEDIKKLRIFAGFLFESVASEISYTKLTNKLKSLGFNTSKNTVIEYISYFEEAYLFFQNLKYEYSLMKQLGSIKKLYCIDNGLLNSVSFKFASDFGKLIENLVFVELKRRNKEIYYFSDKNECDFLVKERDKITFAIQVCYDFNDENKKREINGLVEALERFNLKEGIILTYEQEDEFVVEKKRIKVVPVWKWLLSK